MNRRRVSAPLSISRIASRVASLFVAALLLALVPLSWMAGAQERAAIREHESPYAGAARAVAEKLVAAFPRVEGMIVEVENEQVLIDRGSAHGVFQGMELEVFREGKEFRHPLTQEVLGRLDDDLGTIRVLQVRERYSVAAITRRSPQAAFRRGDGVRVSMARMIVALPSVEVEGVKGANARAVTKDLATALARTGRFELVEDRQIRSMVLADGGLDPTEVTDPRILKELHLKTRAQALFLARLSPLPEGISLDVQVFSTQTASPLLVASAEVAAATAGVGHVSPGAREAHAVAPGRRGGGQALATASRGVAQGTAPPLAIPRPALDGFRLGVQFDRAIQALAAGDLDGDGRQELVLVSSDLVMTYRLEGRRLYRIGEQVSEGRGAVIVLETGDLTGDGRAEVVIAWSHRKRVHSRVLEWRGGRLVPVWEAPNVLLRALSPDGRTAHLYGQPVQPTGVAGGPIRLYTWDGRTYRPGRLVDAPGDVALSNVAFADLGGGARLLALREGGVLEVHSPGGELLAVYKDGSRPGVPRRLLVEPGADGGRPQVILSQEQVTGSRVLGWVTRRTTRMLTGLRWTGEGFEQAWQAPSPSGTLSDYAVVDLGEGLGRHLLLMVVTSGRLGFGSRSEIYAFRLR